MSDNRPSQTTINGMTLERAEQRFNEYRDSHKGSTELHDYTCDVRTPALVSYTAMHFAFGAVGTLKFIPFQTAVKIAAHIWQPSEEQLSAFVAPGNFGRRAIKGNANAFAAELLRIPETYNRLVSFKLHIFEIWMPIAADIVEFMSAGASEKPKAHAPYGIHADTELALEELIQWRAERIKSNQDLPSRKDAYALIPIGSDTVKRYARELHDKWHVRGYLPNLHELLNSLNS